MLHRCRIAGWKSASDVRHSSWESPDLTTGEKVGKIEFKLYDDVVPKVGPL